MKDAGDYLAHVKALIALNSQVVRTIVLRFERFSIVNGEMRPGKYSFHWQDASGRLLKRWDNAPHQPEVATYPHHVHNGAGASVLPHEPISAERILRLISDALDTEVET